MSDWDRFLECVPWFVQPGEAVEVGSPVPWTRGAVDGLPELSALLAAATVTPVSVAGLSCELFAWGRSGERYGWVSLPPPENAPVDVPEVLRRFWSVCGGVVEWFAEPRTWWYCHDEVLTVSAARHALSSVVAEYGWAWRDAGLEVPVEAMRPYVTVAIEANGNMTAAHRDTGHLVLFAPDHSFDGVTPLPGSPPYSLYGFDEVPDLAAWVEVCARAWRPQCT